MAETTFRYDSFDLETNARKLHGLAGALPWFLIPAQLAIVIAGCAVIGSPPVGQPAGGWAALIVAGPLAVLTPLALAALLRVVAQAAMAVARTEKNTRTAAESRE